MLVNEDYHCTRLKSNKLEWRSAERKPLAKLLLLNNRQMKHTHNKP